jgi:beta-phosphoglucomutase-like phosphatase (HAD superfamily)
MRLVIFDIDGTLTRTMKADEECFVRSLAEVVVSTMLTLTGLATSRRLMPASSTRFMSRVRDGLLGQARFRGFASTL